jgi:hypothetical protein
MNSMLQHKNFRGQLYRMKNLAKLFLIAGIGLGSLSLSAQDFKVPHETDENKFIPPYAAIEEVMVNAGPYGILKGIWYDKDCKSGKDYYKKWVEDDGKVSADEIFLDVDGDGIPDLSFEQLIKLYKDYLQEQELEKSSM